LFKSVREYQGTLAWVLMATTRYITQTCYVGFCVTVLATEEHVFCKSRAECFLTFIKSESHSSAMTDEKLSV